MENNRDDLLVILAGYKDKMDVFLSVLPTNPGMGSRIAHQIHFPDYNLDELTDMKQPRFANGRSDRHLGPRAKTGQGGRSM